MKLIKSFFIIFILIFCLLIHLSPADKIYAFEYSQFNTFEPNINLTVLDKFDHNFANNSFMVANYNLPSNNNLNRRFAFIKQLGANNQSNITQIGNIGSIVELVQIGDNNQANVNQIANFAKTEVFQFGRNLDVSVDQWRSGSQIYVIQSGIDKYTEKIKIIESK
ncbi:hypothetical protein LJ207_11210 [Halanaerobium sp. Z-7514]|uniref:Uncharacterized protein n=1 Tax=Halanaerobium polyolivorans TaxID=2886943 RepID=A0AAW4X2A0_9FIRM|nr:hypothetical protein [Halanaerobium polyolivorans]MCC3145883.1 hypothetical protein [Halanaerobium polyolivorans]